MVSSVIGHSYLPYLSISESALVAFHGIHAPVGAELQDTGSLKNCYIIAYGYF
jgi:hypothetical protein